MTATIVLVHGAFADSSSWNDVAGPLAREGHHVLGYANPLRGVAEDAAGLTALIRTLTGPLLLVGHSYGGAVITNVPADVGDVIGTVYVAAFALDAAESAADVAGSVPGSSLTDAVQSVALPGGGNELYITADNYHQQFCADVAELAAALMAIAQRPITERALNEASGPAPLWRAVPSWFVFGDQDRNIPVAAHRNMAARANALRTVEIEGGSHVVGVSHPDETMALIREAATARTPAAAVAVAQ